MKKNKTEESAIKKTIMIVDDSETMRFALGQCFPDFNVVYMENGQDALEHIFTKNPPDLILLDMEMPKMNGRIFLRRLRYSQQYNSIPVIFISSVNSRLIINSMVKIGINDYIVKPFKAEELTEKVKKCLGI